MHQSKRDELSKGQHSEAEQSQYITETYNAQDRPIQTRIGRCFSTTTFLSQAANVWRTAGVFLRTSHSWVEVLPKHIPKPSMQIFVFQARMPCHQILEPWNL